MTHPEPIDSMVYPRFSAIATFMRLPHITDLKELDVAILGIPFDTSAGYRVGTRMGPREIRAHSSAVRPYNSLLQVNPFKKHRIADYGDLSVDPFSIEETYKRIESGIDKLMENNVIPVSVGGDHGITYPILKSIAKKHGPVALIQVDAHPDTHDTQFGHKWTHATTLRRGVEESLIIPKEVIQIGIRGTLFYEDDLEYGKKNGFRTIAPEEFFSKDFEEIRTEIHQIVGDTKCYLTFDIDGLDPSCAPGTGVPEIGGLSSFHGLQIIRSLVDLNLVGADLVEVSPPCDSGKCKLNPPAVDLWPENWSAMDIYGKIQVLGPETVWTLLDLTLTKNEASELLDKLELITNTVNDLRKEMES